MTVPSVVWAVSWPAASIVLVVDEELVVMPMTSPAVLRV